MTWDTFRLAEFFAAKSHQVLSFSGFFRILDDLDVARSPMEPMEPLKFQLFNLPTVQAQIAPLLDGSDDDTAVTMGIGDSLPKSLESRNQEVVLKYVTGWW